MRIVSDRGQDAEGDASREQAEQSRADQAGTGLAGEMGGVCLAIRDPPNCLFRRTIPFSRSLIPRAATLRRRHRGGSPYQEAHPGLCFAVRTPNCAHILLFRGGIRSCRT